MPILNYTTKVPVEKTIGEIQKILTKAGANAVLSEFNDDRKPKSISFRINDNHGPIHYRLPADVDGVVRALKLDNEYRDRPHAERVAWRIVKDWLEAQMAIIQAQMAELPQIFLPYAVTANQQTVYELIKEGGLSLLEGPKP